MTTKSSRANATIVYPNALAISSLSPLGIVYFNGAPHHDEDELMQAVQDAVPGWSWTTNRAGKTVLRRIFDGHWTTHSIDQQNRFFAHHSGGKPPNGQNTEHLCVFLTKTSGGVEISALGRHDKRIKKKQAPRYHLFWQSEADRAAHSASFTLSK